MLTMELVEVCELAKHGTSLASVAAEFKIGKMTVYNIV